MLYNILQDSWVCSVLLHWRQLTLLVVNALCLLIFDISMVGEE